VLPLDDKTIADAVQTIAEEREVPMAQVALAWVLHNPVVSAPIVGATKKRHLTAAALDISLTPDEFGRSKSTTLSASPPGSDSGP
jgi:1-deoxyxylulose-5-phosphate synthase